MTEPTEHTTAAERIDRLFDDLEALSRIAYTLDRDTGEMVVVIP